MRIFKSTFAKMLPLEQRDNFVAWEKDATEAAERGLRPADRARGRRMLKRLDKLRDEFFPEANPSAS